MYKNPALSTPQTCIAWPIGCKCCPGCPGEINRRVSVFKRREVHAKSRWFLPKRFYKDIVRPFVVCTEGVA